MIFDKRHTPLVVALCTSCALVAFTFYQHHHVVTIPKVAFYAAAAMICVIGELVGWLRRESCRSKSRGC
ncbi:MAG: hypothetical protein JO356_12415 [Acidobacteria bacterium]|nr:hypothetical protein [Acidobacteriota bacterium]